MSVEWLTQELPRWRIEHQPGVGAVWWAYSPTHAPSEDGTMPGDGIIIVAPTPEELVERVRANERMWALLLGREGRLPVGRPQSGVRVDPTPRPTPQAPAQQVISRKSGNAPPPQWMTRGALDPTDLGAPEPTDESMRIARSKGFEGELCGNCGGFNTKRKGPCLVCTDCGDSSGGCS